MNAPGVKFDELQRAVMALPGGVYVKSLSLSSWADGQAPWGYTLAVTFDESWQLDEASRGRVLASFQEAVDGIVPMMLKVHVAEKPIGDGLGFAY